MYTEDAPMAKFAFDKNVVCVGESFFFEDRSPMPKDSICWLLNGELISNRATLNHAIELPGEHRLALVVFYGTNSDTIFETITVYPLPPKPTITQSSNSLNATNALFYSWFFNENAISNANQSYYLPNESGAYSVEVSDVNGCKSKSDPFSYYLTSAKIVPNVLMFAYNGLFNNELFVEFNNSDLIKDISIYNAKGSKVYSESFKSPVSKIFVNAKHLSEGIYVVFVQGVEQGYTGKIYKKGATR